MSMNINLVASLEMKGTLLNGKSITKVMTDEFGVYQTPTEISDAIAESVDPRGEYTNYIRSGVFSEHDKKHLEQLDYWLTAHEGWVIVWYVS